MHVLSSQENGPHKDKNVKLLLIGTPRESTSRQRIRVPHSCKKVATMKIFLLKTCLVSLTPLLLAILRYVHHKLLPLHSSSNPRVYSNSACMHACRTFALSVALIVAAPPLRIGLSSLKSEFFFFFILSRLRRLRSTTVVSTLIFCKTRCFSLQLVSSLSSTKSTGVHTEHFAFKTHEQYLRPNR